MCQYYLFHFFVIYCNFYHGFNIYNFQQPIDWQTWLFIGLLNIFTNYQDITILCCLYNSYMQPLQLCNIKYFYVFQRSKVIANKGCFLGDNPTMTQPRGHKLGLLNNFSNIQIQLSNILHNIIFQTYETRFITNCLNKTSACQDIAT